MFDEERIKNAIRSIFTNYKEAVYSINIVSLDYCYECEIVYKLDSIFVVVEAIVGKEDVHLNRLSVYDLCTATILKHIDAERILSNLNMLDRAKETVRETVTDVLLRSALS